MASSEHVDLETFVHGVERRNPGQPEFVQAVHEVAADDRQLAPRRARHGFAAVRAAHVQQAPMGDSDSGERHSLL